MTPPPLPEHVDWSLRTCLRADLRAIRPEARGVLDLMAALVGRGGFFAVFLLRLSQWLIRVHNPLGRMVGRMIGRVNTILNGCDIDPEAVIGIGFTMPHPVGIVVGKARIGANVQLLQNVTIGVRRPRSDADVHAQYPVLGNNVWVGAGAVLVGEIRIGDGATIGANAVVVYDVPEGATAVGVPARKSDV